MLTRGQDGCKDAPVECRPRPAGRGERNTGKSRTGGLRCFSQPTGPRAGSPAPLQEPTRMSAPQESSPPPGPALGGAAAAVAAPAFRAVSIVVPTYREAENLPHLIERIDRVRAEHGLDGELLVMDDDSKDGSEEVIAGLNRDWVRFIVRKANRGLSPAVVDGLRAASHDVLVVMDADLSHPPEKIPEM